jgi:hypothetical protein
MQLFSNAPAIPWRNWLSLHVTGKLVPTINEG